VQLNAGRPNINSVRPNINTGRTNINYVRPRVNTVRSRQPVPTRTSNNLSPKRPQDHPLKNMEERGGSVTFGGSKGYITGTLQTPSANVSEEEDVDEELIVVPTAVQHIAAKVGSRKSSTNSKAKEFLTELQNLKAQEKEAYSTGISEDAPEIPAFRRELDALAQKHLREDDSDMPELTIFNKPQKGIFDEASYDDEGMVYDFNNLSIEVAVSLIPTIRIHNIHPQSQILGDLK
ncbi:hypothetical protein Tco_1162081, partial [Tanacetum coccineum]